MSKEIGMSWIEIEKKVQSFVVGDKMHAQSGNIYGVLVELFRHMTAEGYTPAKRFILYYLDQDGKESHWFNTTQIFLIFFVRSNNLSM